jgi:hypothetical protein
MRLHDLAITQIYSLLCVQLRIQSRNQNRRNTLIVVLPKRRSAFNNLKIIRCEVPGEVCPNGCFPIRQLLTCFKCWDVGLTPRMYSKRLDPLPTQSLIQAHSMQNIGRLTLPISRKNVIRPPSFRIRFHMLGQTGQRFLLGWDRLAGEIVVVEADGGEAVAGACYVHHLRATRSAFSGRGLQKRCQKGSEEKVSNMVSSKLQFDTFSSFSEV